MGLFGGSSKTTTNQTQSIASQSQTGDSFASAGDINVSINTLDNGAVQSSLSLADRVTENALVFADNTIKTTSDTLLRSQENALSTALISQQQALAEAAAAREQAIASANSLAQGVITQSGQAMEQMSVFANASFERVADSSDKAMQAVQESTSKSVDQISGAYSQSMDALSQGSKDSLALLSNNANASLSAVSSNASSTQDQMGAVLTDVLTQGQAGLQASAQKSMTWIVGLAAVAVVGVALVRG